MVGRIKRGDMTTDEAVRKKIKALNDELRKIKRPIVETEIAIEEAQQMVWDLENELEDLQDELQPKIDEIEIEIRRFSALKLSEGI